MVIQEKSQEMQQQDDIADESSSPSPSMGERSEVISDRISPASSSEVMNNDNDSIDEGGMEKDNDDEKDGDNPNVESSIDQSDNEGMEGMEGEGDALNLSQRPISVQDPTDNELKENPYVDKEQPLNTTEENDTDTCVNGNVQVVESDNTTTTESTEPVTIQSLESQIQTLLHEKASVEQANIELMDKLSLSSVQISGAKDSAMMATELKKSLEDQMTQRAEVEDVLRKRVAEIAEYQQKMENYDDLKEKYAELEGVLNQVRQEKQTVEQECKKLRADREEYESNQVVLSNRLNNAKKKEANVQNAAGKLESVNEALGQELEKVKAEVTTLRAAKEKHEVTLEKLKKKCVERVKLSEGALVEERNLNEERKKKMKFFVETKAEELRGAKTSNDELRKELDETLGALASVRGKLEDMTMQYEKLVIRNREIIRDMNRMKKNSEHLHQMGDNLELELHKSAQETEEHKNKRLTAKHELMTILRKLEAEQGVSNKLRDSVKFTFTPKALSQQQLLTESLNKFESQLAILARRLGKTTPVINITSQNKDEHDILQGNGERNGTLDPRRGTRSELDTYRLLSNLENETQHVSKCIIAFQSAVETLAVLLDDSNEKTCVSALNDFFNALNAARGQPTNSVHGKDNGKVSVEPTDMPDDEEDGFAGITPSPKEGSERFGLI